MSFAGQVLCHRRLIGVTWPFAIIGKPSVAPAATAPDAAFRNLRRERVAPGASGIAGTDNLRVMFPPWIWRLLRRRRSLAVLLFGCCSMTASRPQLGLGG